MPPFQCAPVESRIDVDGLSHHVLTWEAESDQTLVLLHGWLDLSWSWQPMADHLAPRHRMVAVDFRGHGDTGRVPRHDYYHFPDYLRDLHGLLPRVVRGRTVLVGHSMGGTVASMYAGAFPDRVHRLVVVDGLGAPASEFEGGPDRIARWLHGLDQVSKRAPRRLASVAEAAQRMRAVHPRVPPEVALYLAEKGTVEAQGGGRTWKHDPFHTTRSAFPFYVPHYLAFLRRITCPTLVLHATESFMATWDDLHERAAAIPHRTEYTFADTGHMIHQERPAELAAVLEEFLARDA